MTTQGNFKCRYCVRPVFKSAAGIENHLNKIHKFQYQVDTLKENFEQEKAKPPKITEKVVYRDPPKPEYYTVTGIYCTTCKTATANPGIPTGHSIEETRHSLCGDTTLQRIVSFS